MLSLIIVIPAYRIFICLSFLCCLPSCDVVNEVEFNTAKVSACKYISYSTAGLEWISEYAVRAYTTAEVRLT